MGPLTKETPNKGHNTNLHIKDTSQCTKNELAYSGINTCTVCLFALIFFMYVHVHPKTGQPLYNGQNDSSQHVRYLEVPLYFMRKWARFMQ